MILTVNHIGKRKKKKKNILKNHLFIGWNEWCALPELGVAKIKAKIDTGAKTSAIHAFGIKSYQNKNKKFVKFSIHPFQKRDDINIACHAEVIDERHIM